MADHALTPLLNALQQAIVPPTRTAANLPSPDDLAFERTLSRKLNKNLDAEAERILALASRVLDWAAPPKTGGRGAELDPDLVREGLYNTVVARLDPLLEQADDHIDKHLGQGKHRANQVGAVGAKSADEMNQREKDRAKKDRLPARLLHASGIDKPQKRFMARTTLPRPEVDDLSSNGEEGIPLWKPLLREKVNALDPSSPWLTTELYTPTSSLSLTTNTQPPPYTRYVHPYAAELAALQPPASFLERPDKPKPHAKDSFDKVPFEWVGDEKALERMVEEIRAVGEEGMKDLAIDLEHHDFRTWGGMTCLIQLSTRKKDYVIDALEPAVRDNLDQLNEFFTDPAWVKVFHGANSDIVWLQRDFGLYIVGLFDTYHATKVLGYNQHSLASLLEMYTDFQPDKRYQLADWRIRPLPQEMLHYARSDTHFLLSIYDHLRLALLSLPSSSSLTDALSEVFRLSIPVSAITFSLPPFDHATGHFDAGFLLPLAKHGQLKPYATALAVPTLPIKTGWGPGEAKLEVLRAVVRFREESAREEDESARYVLSIGGVWQLAELGGVGRVRDERDVMQVLGGARGGVSEVVRRRKEKLAEVVREAYEAAVGRTKEAAEGEEVEMSSGPGAMGQSGLAAAEEPVVRPAASLWDDEPVASTSSAVVVQTAGASSFYGSSSAASSSANLVSTTPSSSFFGSASSSSSSAKPTSSRAKGKLPAVSPSAETRAAAVARVHASLVLGGGLAQSLQPRTIPSAAPVSADVEMAEPEQVREEELVAVPASANPDHTYVPLSGRIPEPESKSLLPEGSRAPSYAAPGTKEKKERGAKNSDVIVVSSLKDTSSSKKRKRPVSTSLPSSSAAPSPSPAPPAATDSAVSPPPVPAKKLKKSRAERAALAASLTPHDYSSTPSILDASPALASGAERRAMDKKQRKKEKKVEGMAEAMKKGGKEGGKKKTLQDGIDTSDFGRAPRVNNAPKSASKAATFGKGQ
ncbi:hypothetical protein JCM8547_000509 [Rhodosporidiobolus lusitaniae]